MKKILIIKIVLAYVFVVVDVSWITSPYAKYENDIQIDSLSIVTCDACIVGIK